MTVTQLFSHFEELPSAIYYTNKIPLEYAEKNNTFVVTHLVHGFIRHYGDDTVRDWKLVNRYGEMCVEVYLKMKQIGYSTDLPHTDS